MNQSKVKIWFGCRFFLGLTFLLVLAAFLHFREEKGEVLDLNTRAPRYITAQIDFFFPDQEATLLLKQEAARDVAPIYKIDAKQIHERQSAFENDLIRDQSWRRKLDHTSFEDLYQSSGIVEEALVDSRFTNQRTYQWMQELHFPTEQVTVFVPEEPHNPTELPKIFWNQLAGFLSEEGLEPDAVDFVVSTFKKETWELREDVSAERSLKELVQDAVATKYTKEPAGSRIIDRGERVTARHIAMLQAMKQAEWEARSLWQPLTILGSLFLSAVLTGLCIVYLRLRHPAVLGSLSKMILLVCIVVLTLSLSKICEFVLLNKASYLIDFVRYPLFVPLATLLVSLLLGGEIAFFVSAFLIVVLGVSLATDRERFLIVNWVASLIVLFLARNLHKRKEIFSVCAKAWLLCLVVIVSFSLFENEYWNLNVTTDALSTGIFLLLTAMLVVGLLPILESSFHVMTDMTLMEYMDPNNPLLRRLSLEAPGTYQHCLVVGSLAEAAARAIGVSGLFCRVSTLYHDIGKLFNPHYFTENQLGGFNIHQLLTPQESAHVIMEHVREGEELAHKHHLPKSFIDIIREHHGTTLVYYFYCKQVEQKGGNASLVDERLFRYPGPKAHTKESAIIMLADTVEAASRCLEEVNEERVREMVDMLVEEKRDDGQLDECQLTFEELGKVKKAMIKALLITHHLRVKYPEKMV